jgi:hypothetical protein
MNGFDPSLFDLALSLPADAPNVVFAPDDLANVMWEYGEEALEARIRRGLTLDEQRGIALKAGRLSQIEGLPVQLSLANAAVTVLEAAPRPLARNRRRTRPATS